MLNPHARCSHLSLPSSWLLLLFGILPLAYAWQANAASFSDIVNSRNQTAIQFLNGKGILGGYSDGTFKPDATINRAELAKILVTAAGVNPTVDQYHDCFTDVTTEWFAPFVCYAKQQAWVAGYSDGSFHPSAAVNTAEAIKMILNAQGIPATGTAADNTFNDVTSTAWYAPYVEAANARGLLQTSGGKLGISGNMTRGLVAESIYRALSIKTSGISKFDASSEPGQTQAQGQPHDGFPIMQQDLQKFVDEANAASDKTVLTKDQFTAEMTSLRQQQMAKFQQQFSGGQSSQWAGRPFQDGQHSSRPGEQDRLATAVTFWKYTDPSGNEVLLALDANGQVVTKWPMAFGGHRGRGGAASSQG